MYALACIAHLLTCLSPQGMHAFMGTGQRAVLATLRINFTGWGFTDDDYALMYSELVLAYQRLLLYEQRRAAGRASA